ncbi:hypothetical protein B0H63DRAFT_483812 [Podospora didyma]|uniref:Uncharacterized protein n=1 Tax=Podospora didyma TaxID=330526 RepID=A0AAE0K8D9_9PEZI|nr:hypothetical protein B0H63DRAFT_483812 [Podospora didyma]
MVFPLGICEAVLFLLCARAVLCLSSFMFVRTVSYWRSAFGSGRGGCAPFRSTLKQNGEAMKANSREHLGCTTDGPPKECCCKSSKEVCYLGTESFQFCVFAFCCGGLCILGRTWVLMTRYFVS